MKRLLLLMACAAAAACSADWRDTSLPPQKRAELLTAEMTLDEKIGQLTSPYGWVPWCFLLFLCIHLNLWNFCC